MTNARRLADKANYSSVLQVATTTFDGRTSTSASGAPSTITNGVQIFSLSFTPKSATSTILVQTSTVAISEEANVGNSGWLALWNGSTFVAAASGTATGFAFANYYNVANLSLNNSFASGSTSTRTIQVRAGFDAGTAYINGMSTAGNNYSGSSSRIQMTVWELAA